MTFEAAIRDLWGDGKLPEAVPNEDHRKLLNVKFGLSRQKGSVAQLSKSLNRHEQWGYSTLSRIKQRLEKELGEAFDEDPQEEAPQPALNQAEIKMVPALASHVVNEAFKQKDAIGAAALEHIKPIVNGMVENALTRISLETTTRISARDREKEVTFIMKIAK